MKSQVENPRDADSDRGVERTKGVEFHIKNKKEEGMERAGWKGEGGLKSQIENEEKERMGRGARRREG